MNPSSHLALTVGLAAETVRESGVVVHCVAPREATAFVADVLHAVGASAVITGTSVAGLKAAGSADALALDLATLTAEGWDPVGPALSTAAAAGTPWVLDATKLGRQPLRAGLVQTLLGHRPAMVVVDEIDADVVVAAGVERAIVTEGTQVLVGDGELVVPPMNTMLAKTPGVRAAASALIAACLGVAPPLEAALAGAAWMSLASERAARNGRGPARYRMAFIDELSTIHGDEIAEHLGLR